MTDKKHTGQCLCGAVKYETTGPLRHVVYCHCKQCQRQTGHFMAATASFHADFKVTEDRGLKWYRASDFAKRGFCNECGSTLFWQHDDAPHISITTGTLDDDSDIPAWGHIFSEDKAHNYEIDPAVVKDPNERPPFDAG